MAEEAYYIYLAAPYGGDSRRLAIARAEAEHLDWEDRVWVFGDVQINPRYVMAVGPERLRHVMDEQARNWS